MFCPNCGKEIDDRAVICVGCGCPVTPVTPMGGTQVRFDQNLLIGELCQKIRTEAIVWTVIACIQAVLGMISFLLWNVTSGVILLTICVLNFITSANDFSYARSLPANPVGIVKKYEPVTGLAVMLVYNLIFGGVIGVLGTVFGFLTRSYVMDNAPAFQAIEQQHGSHI